MTLYRRSLPNKVCGWTKKTLELEKKQTLTNIFKCFIGRVHLTALMYRLPAIKHNLTVIMTQINIKDNIK